MRIKIPFTNRQIEFRKHSREEMKQLFKRRNPLEYIIMELEDLRKEVEEIKVKVK